MAIELSIVIPTFNRKGLLQEVLESLFNQSCDRGLYEIIVVDDGSTDGTADLLEQLDSPVQLRFYQQANQGWAAARNLATNHAQGSIILCLDDDVIASPQLVEEHLRCHRAWGECVVIGRLCLHRRLGRHPYIKFFAQAYEKEYARMEQNPAQLRPSDFYSGNASLPRDLLVELGGFNEELGRLADADGELGYRLWQRGIKLVFNRKALGYLVSLKDFEERCQRSYAEGRSAVKQHELHPESVWKLALGNYKKGPLWRRLLRNYLLRYGPDSFPLKLLRKGIRCLEFTRIPPLIYPWYRLIFDYYFWAGVQEEAATRGGIDRYIPKRIPVLTYHLISKDPPAAMKRWSVTPRAFQRQMAYLHRKGYQSITLEQLWDYLTRGTPLPPKPICITFDDGYQSHHEETFSLLAQYGFSATVFLVADFVGKANEWDRIDPPPALLSWEQILTSNYPTISFQSHSLSHKKLTSLSYEEINREIGDSAQTIKQRLGKPVEFFAYPYGKFNQVIRSLVMAKGYKAAFSVQPGLCQPRDDLFSLRRIEIFSSDYLIDFILKLNTGYNWRGWLRRIYRRLLGKETPSP